MDQREQQEARLGFSREVFATDWARKLLTENGLADIDAVFAAGSRTQLRHTGRGVWETRLADEHGESVRVFVKMHWGRRRLWPRMTDLKTGQVFQSLPEREWRGIRQFQSIGLNVPERLVLFRDGMLSVRSAIVVREVLPRQSIDEMLQDGSWQQLSLDHRASLLEEVMSTLHTMYSAGVGWRGVSSRHFYPELQPDNSWKIWLIDCEGVHNRVTQKTISHGFQKLWRSMKESGADEATLDALETEIDRLRSRLSAA